MLKGQRVILREKMLSDARQDYTWRADEELARLDASVPIKLPFSDFMAFYIEELEYPTPRRRRFAIDSLDGRHIGNCMYYDIDFIKKEAEVGIMIGDKAYWNKGYGADAMKTLLEYIFTSTTLERVYLHTLDWNIRAQKCFEKCGFTTCGKLQRNGQSFVVMEAILPQGEGRAEEAP
ncbi:MAG: GNAT family N-acetyltransferase [Chloroflexi bacterium]|nr:GNAT family N-acetyltransferase [Chloroflexota bacterium]